MFGIRELNVGIESWGAAFCLVGIMSTLLFTRTDRTYRNYFLAAFTLGFASAMGDALAGIYRGLPGGVAWAATHFGNPTTFIAGTLLVAVFSSYIHRRINDAGGSVSDIWSTVIYMAALGICILTLTGAFFSIDEGNLYHRNDAYWAAPTYAILTSTLNSVLVLRNRRWLDWQSLLCMLFYTIAPIAASVAQIRLYGLNFAMVTTVLGLVVLFFELQAHSAAVSVQNAEKLAQSKIRLAESRMRAMTLQTHPGLLFETIDTAQTLCDRDPAGAKEALGLFSDYASSNLESVHRADPIPFAEELEHVRTYLELVRVVRKNRITYAIHATEQEFDLPALSVLAVVEEAVERERLMGEQGSVITISAGKATREYWVSVVDTTPVGPEEATGTPSGLDYTRSYLKTVRGARADVVSQGENGTTIMMRIPKQAKGTSTSDV